MSNQTDPLEFRPQTQRTIAFWEEFKSEFPILSECAKRILHIPASSSSIEQTFSRMAFQFTDNRECLKSKTLLSLVQQTQSEEFLNGLEILECSEFQNSSGQSSSPPLFE